MIHSDIIVRIDLILSTQKLITDSSGYAEIHPGTATTPTIILLTYDSPNLSIPYEEYSALLAASMQAALGQVEISSLSYTVDPSAEKLYIKIDIPQTEHNNHIFQVNSDEFESIFEA